MHKAPLAALLLVSTAVGFGACGSEPVSPRPVELSSAGARVRVDLSPFQLHIMDADGNLVLETYLGSDGAYGAPAATIDSFTEVALGLEGYDGYRANEAPWRRGVTAALLEQDDDSARFALDDNGLYLTLEVTLDGGRVRLSLDAREAAGAEDAGDLNKSTIAFAMPDDEHFFGLGERFASVDHRGYSLYSWAEEGGLGRGEDAAPGPENPAPNGPSMTYFPVPFFLSNKGYGVELETTYRTELHLGSEKPDGWRAAANTSKLDATIYVDKNPLGILEAFTADTGRPTIPSPWVFGPRRRVGSGSMVDGVEEFRKMREEKIPVTGMDDAVHFLPASSQLGREAELKAWTSAAHALGYKVMAYNNPYVAANHDNATADYNYGKENGYFVKDPNGEPELTVFISGELLQIAAVDLTNPDAVIWFQSLLQRTLDHGYDGWMHDFGEYTKRDSIFFDGRLGDEMHNLYPVLSAKAAFDLLEAKRPNDYLFFVRSGYTGTQQYVPAVWGGDAEATFDETQGLPSTVRAGLNLSMSGVPYWGSDMTGFKCLTDAPNDKEIFLRWVEFGALNPIMMEQNACANPLMPKTKWKLWNDQETIDHYRKYAGLHTRLFPYFRVLAGEAAATGRPMTLHPFLLHPTDENVFAVDDAYYLGGALYVSPVVRRGDVMKETYLPHNSQYVDLDDFTVYPGGAVAAIPAPLGKLPLLLVSDQLLPLLDPSIETLGSATDPSVITLESVSDRLDVMVALTPGGSATLTLEDGTELTVERTPDGGNVAGLDEVDSNQIADCSECFVTSSEGDIERLRVNTGLTESSELAIEDVRLTVRGGAVKRVRWDVLRLP